MTFWVMLGGCSIALRLVSLDIASDAWQPLWAGTGMAAIATTMGYLLNNFGIRAIGVTPAFLASASTPMMTTAIAWLTISEVIEPRQVGGIFLVVAGVAIVGLERWHLEKT